MKRDTEARRFRVDPDVVHTLTEDGAAVLLQLQTSEFFTLNPSGAEIWRLLADGHSVEEAGRHLCELFEVDAERARRSVERLAEEFCDQGLIHPLPPESSQNP